MVLILPLHANCDCNLWSSLAKYIDIGISQSIPRKKEPRRIRLMEFLWHRAPDDGDAVAPGGPPAVLASGSRTVDISVVDIGYMSPVARDAEYQRG